MIRGNGVRMISISILQMWWLSDHSYDLEHDQVDQVDNGDNKTHKKETLKCTSLGGRVTQYWCPKCFSWSLTMMFWTHFPPVPSWWRAGRSSRGGRWWSRRTCSTHPSTRWNPAEIRRVTSWWGWGWGCLKTLFTHLMCVASKKDYFLFEWITWNMGRAIMK